MIEKFKMQNKNVKLATISFILGFIALCLIITGQSFAIFSGTFTDANEQVVKLGNLEVIMKEPSTGIDLGLSPMTDVEGLLQEEVYTFTVENTGSANAKYKVLIIDDETSKASYTGTLLDKNLIKLGLEINGEEKGPLTLSELKELLNEKELKSGKKDTYKLRLWIDESANLDEISEQQVFLKLKLEADQYFSEIIINNLDKSGANEPALTSNMIPVYYDSTSDSWKKADSDNADKNNQWYDYDNKMWANAVTVTSTNRDTYLNASVGTTIPMDDINTMWVWIPRYTYTYLNTNTPEEIQIKFESGTNSSGTIKCTDAVTGTSTTSETCTDSTNGSLVAGTSTYTHPAFWWDKNDNNVRESGEELTGIWVGKFEVSSDTTCTPKSSDGVGSGCNLQTIRPLIKPDVQSWRGAQVGTFFNGIQKMSASGNQYGFATTDETHMMKNMEWGAAAYLSHSKYGINKKININNSSDFYTGRSGGNVGGSTAINTVYTDQTSKTQYNKYGFYTYDGYLLSYDTNTKSSTRDMSKIASSTGNIYGIYDLSGGSLECMMGNMVYSNGQQMSGYQTNNNYNSAFTGILSDGGTSFTGTYAFPSKRYYDKYSYGTSSTEYTRGKLGDATVEMAPTGTGGNWYSDYAYFPSSSNPWFYRGGNYSASVYAGAFYFRKFYGYAGTGISARAVLSGALD